MKKFLLPILTAVMSVLGYVEASAIWVQMYLPAGLEVSTDEGETYTTTKSEGDFVTFYDTSKSECVFYIKIGDAGCLNTEGGMTITCNSQVTHTVEVDGDLLKVKFQLTGYSVVRVTNFKLIDTYTVTHFDELKNGTFGVDKTYVCGSKYVVPATLVKNYTYGKAFDHVEVNGKRVEVGDEVTITADTEIRYKYKDEVLCYNVENGHFAVAPMAFALATQNKAAAVKSYGFGDVTVEVHEEENEAGEIFRTYGVMTYLPDNAKPTSVSVPEDLKVEIADGEVRVSAGEASDVSVYAIGGREIAKAEVAGEGSVRIAEPGVHLVVVRRGGNIIYAQKVAVK